MSPENTEKRLAINKVWRDKNKPAINKNKANYYQNHKEKLKIIRKKYHKEHPEIDRNYKQSPKGRIMIYKRGAKKRNLAFKLTLNWFIDNWNKQCAYCGDVINGIGVDRIDNLKGYAEDNVVICCEMCNKMKLNYRKENFIEHCLKITNYNKKICL